MTLEEYVLTYKDEGGNIVVTVASYYEKYIKPLSPRFARSSFYSSRLVVCCFKDHEDVNPSLGTTNHRYLNGVKVYHCFGCGASGTVIRLHQRIQKEYYGRTISDTQSALELCQLYGIDAEKYKTQEYEGEQSRYVAKMRKTAELATVYTLKEFSNDLRKVRCSPALTLEQRKKAINSATIKYVATSKKLF